MCKGIFITATGTDVGKTYITARIIKGLIAQGINAGYYKAALSGTEVEAGKKIAGDAAYVFRFAGIKGEPNQAVTTMLDYPASPHLAAQMENKLAYTKGGAVYWPDHYQSDTSSDYLSVILQNLKNGKPTIVGAKNSSGKAHWVVVTGYDGGEKLSASGFSINDPGSGSRSRLSDLFADYPSFYKLEYY